MPGIFNTKRSAVVRPAGDGRVVRGLAGREVLVVQRAEAARGGERRVEVLVRDRGARDPGFVVNGAVRLVAFQPAVREDA